MPEHILDPELRNILDRLFARQTFGVKLGLEPTRLLLETFGTPQEQLRVVHVAGTNGKGSVCAMIASVLSEAGHRVGLYSSPHLINFRERMRVNGKPISEEQLALYAKEMMPEIERIGCTFFEGTTAIALRYFADENVDIVVLETGMGGRLDATNVVTPLLSIITSIGLDHTRHLGETYEEIALEKAGIMKEGVPTIVGRIRPRLRALFTDQGNRLGSSVTFVEDGSRALHHETNLRQTVGSFIVMEEEIDNLSIDLPGKHQIENARVALAALRMLPPEFLPNEDVIRSGFRSIRQNTGIRGRFDHIAETPDVLLDVAHNADGAKVLAETLAEVFGRREAVRFVYGAVRDKDVGEVARLIAPFARTLHAVSAENPRSLPSDEIAYWCREAGVETVDAGSVEEGVRQAIALCEGDEAVMIFGSFFVVGEAIEVLEEMPVLLKNGRVEEDSFRGGVTHGYDGTPHEVANSELAVQRAVVGSGERNGGSETDRVTIKEWHPNEQPRERLLELGPQALSDAELIAILLRTGTPDKDVLQLSRELLRTFGSGIGGDRLIDIAGRDIRELQQVRGIGPTKAITLAAAFELGSRVASRSFSESPVMKEPKDIARFFIPRMRALRKEQFHVIVQNTAGQIIRTELVSEGNLNSSIVTPREVYRAAIIENAASIIGLHNHPSGNPKPSFEDIAVTRQLVEAGRILQIPFHDHIIIAGEEYVSMLDEGLM
ncbi:MAG: DNA repair protein RadC [Ignavibacteriae bacterium]|nr:DNA repair protein RadC [Ignavibacteriota bacterium]MCB9217438.1 DNA repair protein RadC [Ignavibacteria bacterium]